jgi:hypothetical protein
MNEALYPRPSRLGPPLQPNAADAERPDVDVPALIAHADNVIAADREVARTLDDRRAAEAFGTADQRREAMRAHSEAVAALGTWTDDTDRLRKAPSF